MRRDGSISVFCDEVSIHASVKDATKPASLKRDMTAVSIHASVKDATLLSGQVRHLS